MCHTGRSIQVSLRLAVCWVKFYLVLLRDGPSLEEKNSYRDRDLRFQSSIVEGDDDNSHHFSDNVSDNVERKKSVGRNAPGAFVVVSKLTSPVP